MKRAKVKLMKQPQKYLAKVDSLAYRKLRDALRGLAVWKGDIIKLKNSDYYRLKIPHYRIIFTFEKEVNIISVEEINSRTNIKYRRYMK